MRCAVAFPFPFRVAVVVVCSVMCTSCSGLVDSLAHDDRPLPNNPEVTPVLRDAVGPELLPLVGTDGLFRYPIPKVAVGEMPLDTALAQAVLFLDYAQNTYWRIAAEVDRGALIEMGKLTPCGQMHLVRSKYEPPPDSVHRVFRVRLGDHWSIAFCGGFKGPDVVVTVATRSNAARFIDGRATGRPTVLVGPLQATEFVVRGLPWWWGAEQFVTPEEAVNEVFAQTGVRATALPELFRGEDLGAEKINGRPLSGHVACSVWRVPLERPARVRTPYTNRSLELRELFVADTDCPGPFGTTALMTPWPEQPTTRDYPLPNPDRVSSTGPFLIFYQARIRAPVDFETVIIER